MVELVYMLDEKSSKCFLRSKSTAKVPFKLFGGYIINGGYRRIYITPTSRVRVRGSLRAQLASVPCREVLWYCLQKEWLCLTTASFIFPKFSLLLSIVSVTL